MNTEVKIIIAFIASFIMALPAFAQFTGTCPETSSCNVGIGTTAPSAQLTILDDQTYLTLPGAPIVNPFEINRKIYSGRSTTIEPMFTLTPLGKIGLFNSMPNSSLHINAPLWQSPFEITKTFDSSIHQIMINTLNFTGPQLNQSSLINQKDASIIFTDNANGNNASSSLVIAPRMSSNAGGIKIGNTGQLSVVNSELILDKSRLVINNGTINQFQVTANGLVAARQIDVHLDRIPDFVFHAAFDTDSATYYKKTGLYEPMTLLELDSFVQVNRHLPGIKSAVEYQNVGSINVGKLQLQLLQKIEEPTLYNIELMEQLETLKQKQVQLEQQLNGITK